METKHDTAKLAADIEVLKFQIQCLQRDNNMLMEHLGKTADRLAGYIDTTNVRVEKIYQCVKHVSEDLARDGRATLNHLMRLDTTVEQLQAVIMPTVTAFENDVANIIVASAYDARERPLTTSPARNRKNN